MDEVHNMRSAHGRMQQEYCEHRMKKEGRGNSRGTQKLSQWRHGSVNGFRADPSAATCRRERRSSAVCCSALMAAMSGLHSLRIVRDATKSMSPRAIHAVLVCGWPVCVGSRPQPGRLMAVTSSTRATAARTARGGSRDWRAQPQWLYGSTLRRSGRASCSR
jgi:hypothetical protein